MKNETYKLSRDLFHALSIGAFGVAFFAPNAPIEARVAAAIGGFYFHLFAHLARPV